MPSRRSPQKTSTRVLFAIAEFVKLESSGGLILIASAAVALFWANGPWGDSYTRVADLPLGFELGSVGIRMPLLLWVNDGLMAIFFFVVGLEIKRELTSGELANRRSAALPVAAALGGLAAPAMLFMLLNAGLPTAKGWGVPIATDIAFSLAVLSLLGRRVPIELKVFLTAIAIVDDIGAVAVIAAFYSSGVQWTMLALAGGVLVALGLLSRMGMRSLVPFAFGGIVLWLLFLNSGIHATLAGVLLAFTIPSRPPSEGGTYSALERAEHAMLPWATYLAIPAFGLLNAGVAIDATSLALFKEPLFRGIVLGLVIGKPLGILAFSWLAVRLGLADLPNAVTWRHVGGVSCLAGIGFTMSIFIAELAFPSSGQIDTAKLGVLVASGAAALVGVAVLTWRGKSVDGQGDLSALERGATELQSE